MTKDTRPTTSRILLEAMKRVECTSNQKGMNHREEKGHDNKSSARDRAVSEIKSMSLKWIKVKRRHYDKNSPRAAQ